MATSAPARIESYPAASVAVHVAFVVNGIVAVLLAPMLPLVSQSWHLPDATQIGALFTAQFAGSLTGTLISGSLVSRRGFRASLAPGYLLMAAGVFALSCAQWPAGLACVLLYGIGIGLSIPPSNVFVATNMPHRRGAALNILNFAWTGGAIACPFLFAAARGPEQWRLVLRGCAVVLVAVAVSMARVTWPAPQQEKAGRLSSVTGAVRMVAVLAAMSFLYIGAETAIAGWISVYSIRFTGSGGFLWILVPSFFFAALLLGRLGAPAALRRVGESALIRFGLLVATVGIVIVIASPALTGVIAGVTIAGLGMAPVFPLLLAAMAHAFGPAAPRAASAMFAAGGIGGACLPWMVGALSDARRSMQAGLAVTAVAATLTLLIHVALAGAMGAAPRPSAD